MCRLLSVRKSKTVPITFKGFGNTGKKGNTKSEKSYDRCLLLGDIGSARCCVILLQKHETRNVLPLQSKISVGGYVAVAEPRFADAFLSGTATPVIQTDNWLLPIKANPVSIDINEVPDNASFFHFCVIGCKLAMTHSCWCRACGGWLCDAQCGAAEEEGCVAICRSKTPSYVVKTMVYCDQFPDTVRACEVRGQRLTTLMSGCGLWQDCNAPPSEPLRTTIRRVTEVVNDRGGWTIAGWLKPGVYSEEGTTSAPLYKLTEKLHISAIWPAQWEALEETIIALRVASEEVQEIRWEVDEEPDEEVNEFTPPPATSKQKKNTGERKKVIVLGGGNNTTSKRKTVPITLVPERSGKRRSFPSSGSQDSRSASSSSAVNDIGWSMSREEAEQCSSSFLASLAGVNDATAKMLNELISQRKQGLCQSPRDV